MKKIAGDLPIFVAGDLLHRWNEPAELVNLLIRHMPHVYAVAGNHDLPNHNLADLHRSAFWTLVEVGKVTDISMGAASIGDLQVHGFGCGVKVRPRKTGQSGIGVAVVHTYVWLEGHQHPGALLENHARTLTTNLKGYDVIHTGDNHKPFRFLAMHGALLYNSGAFICRRADERRHKPRVGILHSDGTVTEKFLDVSGDKWVDALSDGGHDEEPVGQDFVDALLETSGVTDDFADAVAHYARRHKGEITKGTRRLLVRIMEESRE